jgi:hypothetical protein
MSVTLPGELVWALSVLGLNWPEADEDRLRECAQHWRDFSSEMGHVQSDCNRVVAQIGSENRGASIDAFEGYWQVIGGGGGHLAEAQEAASLAADCLEAFAVVVEGLKAAVIAQLVIFVAEFLAAQAAAPETLGLSEGVAAAETVATRSILRALMDDGIQQVTRDVLQQLRDRASEIFLKMLKRALVTGGLSTGLDLARQEYEVNVLHTRPGLSVSELVAAGGSGAVLGAASTLFHIRLEGDPTQPEPQSPVAGVPRVRSGLKVDIPKAVSVPGGGVREFAQTPLAHGFPDIIDNYAGAGSSFTLANGATLYQVAGALAGVEGRFEWIVDNGSVTHRMFISGGSINGIPIKR